MEKYLDRILITEDEINQRVKTLAKQIDEDYKDSDSLISICVLKGAVIFFSQLVKYMKKEMVLDFMIVSSYGDNVHSSGNIKILLDMENDVRGKDVLIIEDVIDTGYTLERLTSLIKERGAKSVSIAALLDKKESRKVDVEVKYAGFEIGNEFVVGYGLDYAQKYRNLPYIGVLNKNLYSL